MEAFTDLATAAYCPRKLYYRRKHDDGDPPDDVAAVRALAHRYPELLDRETALESEPIAVAPEPYRSTLSATKARLDCWERLVDRPTATCCSRARTAAASHTRSSRPRRDP